MRPVERVLYIRTDRLGDVLMNLPAVHLVRQAYPKSWITWMVSSAVAPILRDHPDVDEVMAVDPHRLSHDAVYRRGVFREVKKARFDVGIAANSSKLHHWLMWISGIPVRCGWDRKWGFLLNRKLRDDKSARVRHEIDSNLALVKKVVGASWDGRWSMPVQEKAAMRMRERLKKEFGAQDRILAVHAGSSLEAKRWPAERFAELCAALLEERYRVLLIGAADVEPASKAIHAQVEGVTDWTGATDLTELSALLADPAIRGLVSCDSGPVHVAWLHHKPVVAMYAADVAGSDPRRWGPRSAHSVAIHKSMREITVDEVLAAVRSAVGAS